jgi:hypothetical protein
MTKKGQGIIDDIKEGFKRITMPKANTSTMTATEKTMAKLSQQAYKVSPLENVDGYTLILNDKRVKLYEKDNKIVVSIRGTLDTEDVKDDIHFALNRLETSPRFIQLKKIVANIFAKFPEKDIYFTGHSLGGGMVFYLVKVFGSKIKGDVFNPATNLEVLRSIAPKNVKAHIIEGDIVSDALGKFLPNKQVYTNPYGSSTELSHNIKSHKIAAFI